MKRGLIIIVVLFILSLASVWLVLVFGQGRLRSTASNVKKVRRSLALDNCLNAKDLGAAFDKYRNACEIRREGDRTRVSSKTTKTTKLIQNENSGQIPDSSETPIIP